MPEPRGLGLGQLPGSSSDTSPRASSNAASPRTLPSVRYHASGDDAILRTAPLPPPTLPPLPRSRSETPGDAASDVGSKRSFVHSILNPPQAQSEESQRTSRMSSPISSQTSPNTLPSLISRPSSTDTSRGHGADSPRRRNFSTADPIQRQILSATSPRLQRATSMGRLPQPAGNVDGLQFLHEGNRRFVVETGNPGVPLLPNPSGQRAGFVYDNTHSALPNSSLQQQQQQQQSQQRHASIGLGPIEGASPRPLFATHNHSAHGSPAMPYATTAGPSPTPPYPPTPSSVGSQLAPIPAVSFESERHYGGAAHTGQSVIQMMAVETGQGIVQVPVDVQAASRVADEKRKRNAGASARFRQRRKEKEMQASNMISRLEQDLQEARDDVEFYRRERDTLSNILVHVPGYERHFPRPTSPRHRRQSVARPTSSSGTQAGSTNSSSAAYSALSERSPPPLEGDRSKRRRTSGYSLPPPTNASTAGGMAGYAPASFASLMSPTSQQLNPAEFRGGVPGARPTAGAALPGRLQEPFREEQYERSWPPAERGVTDRRGA